MEYVLTENGNIKVTDGKPTVKDGDKEFGIDALEASNKIQVLTAESNDRRKKLGEAIDALAKFDGIPDPAAAISALGKVDNMDKDVADQIDAAKKLVVEGYEVKISEMGTTVQGLESKLKNANVLSKFHTSEVAKTLTMPPSIAASYFSKHFDHEGKAIGYNDDPIYSKERPGEPASFDEALTHLIDNHPERSSMIKASGGHGGGGHQGGNGAGGAEVKSSKQNIAEGLAAL